MWRAGRRSTAEIALAQDDAERTERELAAFVIPGGTHKGIRLGDKPDAFWEQYVVELRGNIAKIAADKQAIAQDTIDAITLYLKRA